jgi:peptidoglycan/LPS O-acetylase OafA/YrhL
VVDVEHVDPAAGGSLSQTGRPRDDGGLPYVAALDGLRGLAVLAVLLFHGSVPGFRGGHLGVSVFFTLSGFLITALLVVERRTAGRIELRRFWTRRARRLVPAMILTFFLVAVVLRLSPNPPSSGVLGDAIASATWVANWRFIVAGTSYADLFALPSPFQHFWSLAVEEQFYVLFPLLVVAVLGRQSKRPRVGLLGGVLVALVAASALQAAHLFASSEVTARAYYGTDARAAELLVGALLALGMCSPAGPRILRGRRGWALQALGMAALAGLAAACVFVAQADSALYYGGLLAVAVMSATVIAAAVQPGSLVSRLLGTAPLVELGIISYGAYLYHWPVFLLLDHRFTGLGPLPLLALRLTVTLTLAWFSYWLVEHPLRYGPLPAVQAVPSWAIGATAGVVAVGLAAGQITLPNLVRPAQTGGAVATVARAPATPQARHGGQRLQGLSVAPARPGPSLPMTGAAPAAPAPARPTRRQAAMPADLAQSPKDTPVPPMPEVPPGAVRVAVVGDSVAGNLGQGLRILSSERSDLAVYNLALPGCPLTRGRLRRLGPDLPFDVDPVCAWWADPSSERRQALERFRPDVIVTEDGINEVLDRKLPSWSEWRGPDDARFDSWAVGEYRTAVSQWSADAAKVLVVNAPCGDWQRYDAYRELKDPELRVTDLNLGVYRQVPAVTHADLFQRVCPTGRYQDDVEGIPDGRPDGFHFAPEASAALARNWLGPLVFDTARGTPPLAPHEPAPR